MSVFQMLRTNQETGIVGDARGLIRPHAVKPCVEFGVAPAARTIYASNECETTAGYPRATL